MATERDDTATARSWGGGIEIDPGTSARIQHLGERIETLRASYYAGNPEVSDAAFDALEDELRELAPTHPVLAKVGSGAVVAEWDKARHEIPMGSLNKAVSEEELRAWVARCEELLAKDALVGITADLFVAEKLDGISIEVIYRDGKLVDGITRGDGEWGQRITPNVAKMKGVPSRIKERGNLSVRGEIILRLSDMALHPVNANKKGTSPRNMAAGASLQRRERADANDLGPEHLTVLFYDVADHLEFATEVEKFAYIRGLGFATPRTAHGTLDEALTLYAQYGAEVRASLDYEIDGLVVYVNDRHAQTVLGEVNHRPRGAVAFKFASQAKVTSVLDLRWDTGPSGRVTPVAIVAPVMLAGAKVERASLHNAANVRALGISIGDEVLVSRRNDVIPYVEEVVERRGTPVEAPTSCPVCHEPLSVEGEYLVCRNKTCRAIVEGRIQIWIGVLDALGWGERVIQQLVATKLVQEPRDLYALDLPTLAALDLGDADNPRRFGEKNAKKCLDQLRGKLPLTLPTFLAALGMDNFGRETARLLVSAGYNSIEKLLAATEDPIAAIPGLGAIKAASIVRGLRAREAEIGRLLEAGIVPVTPDEEGALSGLSFCFTGASSRPRAELTAMVESRGGRVHSSTTKDTTYLVIADPASTSSKAVKARKYGTKLITEEEFSELIAEREGELRGRIESRDP